MGVHGYDGFVDIRDAIVQAGNDVRELERHGVADGVRDINRRGAGVDGGFYHARQIGDRRTARIFTGEFDVVGIISCAFNHIDCALDDLIQGATQLGGDVHRRGGDKSVNAERFSDF